MTTTQPVAFLDRDSTTVRYNAIDGAAVSARGTVELVDGAAEACGRLKRLGFALVMVTNQPDVARGTLDRETVERANEYIAERLGLDLVLACMHDDLDRCTCRKPRPGLLLEAATILGASLDRSSVIIGDRWRDIDAGVAAGTTTVLLDRGYGELLNCQPDHVARDLVDAVEWIGVYVTTNSR
ncbi:MAG: D-glycero-alpha-D-manno-heptose-1,7-bisphosphate 7-phosphatase [Ilumatobacteraceae bacterium]